jgi:16S rRNA (adenine1518-N6/adenine1519-N6)-dimethyltransferase
MKDQVPQVVGMFQKEVAERIAAPPGSKTYGIISVLLQAYFDIEYLFTVNENVFNPPPKVKSAVIRVTRNNVTKLDCNEVLFKQLIKAGFNQRRKMLRNSIKGLINKDGFSHYFLTMRPEQLSVADFVELTNAITHFQSS